MNRNSGDLTGSPVLVFGTRYQWDNEQRKKVPKRFKAGEGTFLAWGLQHCESATGAIGHYTSAIVKMENGDVCVVDPVLIRFTEGK